MWGWGASNLIKPIDQENAMRGARHLHIEGGRERLNIRENTNRDRIEDEHMSSRQSVTFLQSEKNDRYRKPLVPVVRMT